jgi:hypothetical protein
MLRATPLSLLDDWRVGPPILTALSALVALAATAVLARLWRTDNLERADYLNDPNWPLPAGAQRQIATNDAFTATDGRMRAGR